MILILLELEYVIIISIVRGYYIYIIIIHVGVDLFHKCTLTVTLYPCTHNHYITFITFVLLKGSDGIAVPMEQEKPSFMEDGGLMEINEDEEEDDEEQEIKNNNVSPFGTQSGPTSDSDVAEIGDDTLKGFLNGINGYHDDQSRTTSTTIDGFDYSYDAEVVVKHDEDDEDLEETGSVTIHSDPEDEDDGGGSVQIHSSLFYLNIYI